MKLNLEQTNNDDPTKSVDGIINLPKKLLLEESRLTTFKLWLIIAAKTPRGSNKVTFESTMHLWGEVKEWLNQPTLHQQSVYQGLQNLEKKGWIIWRKGSSRFDRQIEIEFVKDHASASPHSTDQSVEP